MNATKSFRMKTPAQIWAQGAFLLRELIARGNNGYVRAHEINRFRFIAATQERYWENVRRYLGDMYTYADQQAYLNCPLPSTIYAK